jgi:hypothetical protein
MNQGDSRVGPGEPNYFASQHSGLEQDLKEARALLRNNDLERALELLTHLETEFVRGIELFDCLGDVLLRRGNTQEGTHYKTLYKILKGTFSVVMKDARGLRPAGGAAAPERPLPSESDVPEEGPPPPGWQQGAEWEGEADDFLPVTAAMAHTFMRQGHFGRALEIYDSLIRKNPNDPSVKEAREQALKKKQKKELLEVLQRWLANIEQMKSGRSAQI